MKIQVTNETGYNESLFALGLSYGITSELTLQEFCEPDSKEFTKMVKVAKNLAPKDWGHNSFLEMMYVWVDIDAPRYFWSEMDRYRVGKTQFSESTMHTLSKRQLTQKDFERPIDFKSLEVINDLIASKASVETLKEHLPEGFLQRRVVSMCYKTIRNILIQREGHRLPQWAKFREHILTQLKYPELLGISDNV